MFKDKFSEALHCLSDIIAKEGGGDEDDAIIALDEQLNIKISSKNPMFGGLAIGVWVKEPYSNSRFIELKRRPPIEHSVNDELIGGKRIIKYPQYESQSDVGNNINDDLKYECEIKDKDLTEDEWFKLNSTPEYKKAQVQVTRELVARTILKEKGVEFW